MHRRPTITSTLPWNVLYGLALSELQTERTVCARLGTAGLSASCLSLSVKSPNVTYDMGAGSVVSSYLMAPANPFTQRSTFCSCLSMHVIQLFGKLITYHLRSSTDNNPGSFGMDNIERAEGNSAKTKPTRRFFERMAMVLNRHPPSILIAHGFQGQPWSGSRTFGLT